MKWGGVCPVCRGTIEPLWTVRSYDYYRCQRCTSLTVDPEVVADVDAGRAVRAAYEARAPEEQATSLDRAYGASLACVAEAILYARVPVRRFVDVGAGHGYLLDALRLHLPAHAGAFFGVEPFPPEPHSTHPNYLAGPPAALPHKVDAGCCIEVLQQLTPAQAGGLLAELASRSHPGALYVLNFGQPRYVLDEDPEYLDPDGRGHLVSYSAMGLGVLAEPLGFRVIPLRGRAWSLLLEYDLVDTTAPQDRIWTALPENRALLRDPERGSVLHELGMASARAYEPG